MRKKLLYLFGILLCVICLAFGFSACNSDSNNQGGGNEIQKPTPETPTHTHTLSLVSAKSADCVNSGNTAYYTCTCGKWFTDSNATTEITDKSSVVIGALGHKYSTEWSQSKTQHWHECPVCGNKKDLLNHTAGTAATETTAQVCTVCDYVIAEPLGHTHKTVLAPAKAADCEVDGNIEYYTCACGKWFTDSNATAEITNKSSVVLTATGHSYSSEWSYNSTQHWYAATCKHSNEKSGLLNHDFQDGICSVCKYSVGLLTFKTLQLGENDTAYGKVSNETTTFSFLKEITANNGATYTVCTDMACTQTVPSKTVALLVGDNTFYILTERGNDLTLFTVNIRRRPLFTVTFQTSGTAISSQSVEEDSFVLQPDETTKIGYTFDSWTYGGEVVSFPYAITENITFIAEFTANEYTATLNVNGGDALEKSGFSATYDELFSFITPTRIGYTFLGWYDGETEISNTVWKYADNKTFTAKWQANTYTVILNINDTSAGTVSGNGKYDYDSEVTITALTNKGYTFIGWYDNDENLISEKPNYSFNMGFDITYTAKWNYYTVTTEGNIKAGYVTLYNNTKFSVGTSVTITATNFMGYTWLGWFNGETELTQEYNYTFTMPAENIIYTAKWKVLEEMANFDFTSTETTLTITGIIDNTVTEIIIPNYVTSIGNKAFYYCTSIESVTIGNGVTFIGSKAFYWCTSLKNITIGNSVTFIDESAFYYCSLKRVYITDIAAWCGITFSNPDSNPLYYARTLYYNNQLVEELIIPDNVTSIGKYTFFYCAWIKNVTISNRVTSIGEYAFYDCEHLESIYYKGTADDWEKINIIATGNGNSNLTNATRYYYSETEPSLNEDSTAYDGNYWHYNLDGEIVVWIKEN